MKNILSLLFLMILLSGCSHKSENKNRIIKIESKSYSNSLYYTGTIQPLKTLVIPSPTDGVVIDMPVQYGEKIETGKLLFTLSSSKFSSDYKHALMDYVKAKNDFNNSETQLSEAEFLHKNQLISDDDYKAKKSGYYGAQLSLIQAKDALQSLVSQLGSSNINIEQLSITDIEKITAALHLKSESENLQIIAPVQGVVLSAIKNDEETKKILKGDAVKQGDVLAIIGDMSGISINIKVNELTVNQIKAGQKVIVTGIAFPNDILEGRISLVDRQGDNSNGSAPTFPVQIIVPKLTSQQQENIHVGMSAKVEIQIAEEPGIMIPISAVTEKNGEAFVQVLDAKSHRPHQQLIKTGKSTMDSVSVLSGLHLGDEIIAAG